MNGVFSLFSLVTLSLYEVEGMGGGAVMYIIILSSHSLAGLGLSHVEHMSIERVAPCKAGTDGVTLPVNGQTMENGNQS